MVKVLITKDRRWESITKMCLMPLEAGRSTGDGQWCQKVIVNNEKVFNPCSGVEQLSARYRDMLCCPGMVFLVDVAALCIGACDDLLDSVWCWPWLQFTIRLLHLRVGVLSLVVGTVQLSSPLLSSSCVIRINFVGPFNFCIAAIIISLIILHWFLIILCYSSKIALIIKIISVVIIYLNKSSLYQEHVIFLQKNLYVIVPVSLLEEDVK